MVGAVTNDSIVEAEVFDQSPKGYVGFEELQGVVKWNSNGNSSSRNCLIKILKVGMNPI